MVHASTHDGSGDSSSGLLSVLLLLWHRPPFSGLSAVVGGLFLLFLLFWLFWWAPAHFYILVSEEGGREEGEEQHGAERGGSQGEAHGHGEWGEREAGIAGEQEQPGSRELKS